MKNRNKKWQWIFAAAMSVSLAGSTLAQYRVGTDGRATDANNRIGSGGRNDGTGATSASQYGSLGNSIITGNVTGGKEFRGFVPYTDPREFRGQTAGGLSERFIRSSSGAGFGGIADNNAQVVQRFYGESQLAAPPPPNFTSQGPGTGALVPAPALSRGPGDLRLGQVYETPSALVPQPGQLILPGPVDPNTQAQSVITASPLYGVRQWNLSSESDQLFLSNNLNKKGNISDRFDPVTLQRLRDELTQPMPTDKPISDQPGQEGQQNQNQLNTQMQAPFESPQNKAVASGAIKSGQSSSDAIMNPNLATGEGMRSRPTLVAPERQSTQIAELSKRLQQYRVVKEMADANAARQYQQQMRENAAKKDGDAAKKPDATVAAPGTGAQPQQPTGMGGLGGARTETPTPGGVATPDKLPDIPASTPQPSDLPKPLQIKSLAEGVQAKGLADVLKQAEEHMKAGKYGSALDQFELAEQIAPNNPLILLGRANVELGQSYYNRAEGNLRKAFTQNQELLLGQYDLRSLLGNERLEFLVRDLKEIANQEQKQARPCFLLAYIAYNTGNERQAAAYLDLAEKRAGGTDPLYPLIRKHWSLPKDQPAPELNK